MEELIKCRVCLSTDVKLFNMYQYQLITPYEHLTGTEFNKLERLPHHLCSFCSMLLLKSEEFQQKCLASLEILNNKILIEKNRSNYKSCIDEKVKNVTLPYSMTECLVFDCLDQQQLRLYTHIRTSSRTQENEIYIQSDIKEERLQECKEETADELSSPTFPVFTKEVKENALNEDIDLSDEESFKEVAEIRKKKKKYESEEPLPNMKILFPTLEEQKQQILKRKDTAAYKKAMYKCDICYKHCITAKNLDSHMIRHDPSLPYSCAVCNFTFKLKRSLTTHVYNSHAKHYVCSLCDHVCKKRDDAKEHAEFHKGATFDCNFCDASYSRRLSLYGHMRQFHPAQCGLVCSVCGETFKGTSDLKMHVKRAHGMKFISEVAFASRPTLYKRTLRGEQNTKDNYDKRRRNNKNKCNIRKVASAVCEMCGLNCRTSSYLVLHQRIHSGEKPHQCTECEKRFRLPSLLKDHTLVHTGERPYSCDHCQKTFKLRAALTRHMRIHTGEKPYVCQYCGKAFSQSNSVKKHIELLHMKLPDAKDKHKIKKNLKKIDKHN